MKHIPIVYFLGVIICIASIMPRAAWAAGPGIRFEQGLSWTEIRAKAKAENKYIFMDCYATWCGPCKFMSEHIFPLKAVGDYINDRFISVAVQMDRVPGEPENIRQWHAAADSIEREFDVNAYPTYLIFSPDGNAVHRIIGATGAAANDFIEKVAEAFNPDRQYFARKKKEELLIRQHSRDSAFIRNALDTALAQDEYKESIGLLDYYLDCIRDPLNDDNRAIIERATISTSSRGFSFLMDNADRIKAIEGTDAVEKELRGIIAHDEIFIYDSPVWGSIGKKLRTKYPAYADRVLAESRPSYFLEQQMIPQYDEAIVFYMNRYGEKISDHGVNQNAWNVFLYSTDQKTLLAAAGWSKKLVDKEVSFGAPNPGDMDTYANLLYKTGDRKNAIAWEDRAVQMASSTGKKDQAKELTANLQKMQKGERTWGQEVTQKPPLDAVAIDNWPETGGELISNDGHFISYSVRTGKRKSLVIRSADVSWKKEVSDAGGAAITGDSKRMIFMLPGDTLGILELGKDTLSYLPGVTEFKTPEGGDGELVAWKNKDSSQSLLIQNFQTGNEIKIAHIKEYVFSANGEVIVTLSSDSGKEETRQLLRWMDLKMNTNKIIWTGDNAGNLLFDSASGRLAFIAGDPVSGSGKYAAWQYFYGADSAAILVSNRSAGLEKGFELSNSGRFRFSADGKKLFFPLRKIPAVPDPKAGHDPMAGVNVWSYKDTILQSQQLVNLQYASSKTYDAVISEGSEKIVRLQEDRDEQVILCSGGNGDNVVTITESNISTETNPRLSVKPLLYLVSTRTGVRKELSGDQAIPSFTSTSFSPGGRFVIWYNAEKNAYFTYDITNAITRNISSRIKWPLFDEEEDEPFPNTYPFLNSPIAWMEADRGVLIYDKYDIWQVDPEGVRTPICITNGYGRLHHTVLRCLLPENQWDRPAVFSNGEKLFLVAFNRINKNNGFFSQTLGSGEEPKMLTMGPYLYHLPQFSIFTQTVIPFAPIKAKNADRYLVRRMAADNFPNYYLTDDFKDFEPLSDLQPQKAYIWLSSELMHWKLPDGTTGEGILYKPQDFDRQKKYPIIFFYYERFASGLNQFHQPELSDANLNIPVFVSHGYLVFVPDIPYKVGHPAKSAGDAVISAANYLAGMPWVDRKKMGINGHSFGGFETNTLVTQTDVFAAAAEAAGDCDLFGFYGSLRPGDGWSYQSFCEFTQSRIGATPWQRPDLYIQNSPIFKADKVRTPLLIMHNEGDSNVLWSQGFEWFTALRRLGKKAWMLDYDDEDHAIGRKNNKLDFSIRLMQFFDHYLKGAPAPKWMTEGVPASRKGIDSGLELDRSGALP